MPSGPLLPHIPSLPSPAYPPARSSPTTPWTIPARPGPPKPGPPRAAKPLLDHTHSPQCPRKSGSCDSRQNHVNDAANAMPSRLTYETKQLFSAARLTPDPKFQGCGNEARFPPDPTCCGRGPSGNIEIWRPAEKKLLSFVRHQFPVDVLRWQHRCHQLHPARPGCPSPGRPGGPLPGPPWPPWRAPPWAALACIAQL